MKFCFRVQYLPGLLQFHPPLSVPERQLVADKVAFLDLPGNVGAVCPHQLHGEVLWLELASMGLCAVLVEDAFPVVLL